jgi:hypothetical protein
MAFLNVNITEFLLNGDGSSRASVEKRCSLILLKMLEEGLHADITISAKGGSVKVHRCVLASVSPVFKAMFHHPMREQLTSTVELPDMSIQGLHLFLVLIYLLPDYIGATPLPEFGDSTWIEHFDELIEACCKYQVKRLEPFLTVKLSGVLSPERCWGYLRKSEAISEFCGILDYKSSARGPYAVCRDYIYANFNKVIESENFIVEMQNNPRNAQSFLRGYYIARGSSSAPHNKEMRYLRKKRSLTVDSFASSSSSSRGGRSSSPSYLS